MKSEEKNDAKSYRRVQLDRPKLSLELRLDCGEREVLLHLSLIHI